LPQKSIYTDFQKSNNMPLHKDFSEENIKVWVWRYSENDFLCPKTLLNNKEYEKFINYHPKRLIEILMIRKIIHKFLPKYSILYEQNGKPYLEPNDYNISISHSFPFAVLAISKYKIGIDIEKIRTKILNIKHKFIGNEQSYIPLDKEKEYLTIIWCIKESLYKLHEKNFPSLRENYEVLKFTLNNLDRIRARIFNENYSNYFYAKLRFFDDFFLSIVSDC